MTLTYISCSSDFDTIYIEVPDLLNYKAYNYQTLHSVSPRCTDSAGTLTQWPWPIFCAPVTLTHFASTFDISSTTTIKPYKVFLLNVMTRQVLWLSDLDLYFALHWLYTFHMSSTIRPSTSKPCVVLLLDVKYLDLVTLTYILHSSDFDTFYIDVQYLLKYKPYNH